VGPNVVTGTGGFKIGAPAANTQGGYASAVIAIKMAKNSRHIEALPWRRQTPYNGDNQAVQRDRGSVLVQNLAGKQEAESLSNSFPRSFDRHRQPLVLASNLYSWRGAPSRSTLIQRCLRCQSRKRLLDQIGVATIA